ncbi:MAG: valine--tRNA ligase [Firmicutes bacterium]|nr:valine--tRNA ligase [Bacillota bacterium]
MDKTYQPKNFEDRIYDKWVKGGYFAAKSDSGKEPFCIVIPPPNITGQLHMGHALNQTIQDAIIRYKRMKGFEALWLPGTDHASIATEVRIVDTMKQEEGLTKDDVGRDGFLKRAFGWNDKYGGRIVEQMRRLGNSCDWDRLAFTMDERCSKAVLEAFVRLYNKGLIYKGDRIINWCPKCLTALSDAEVEHEPQDGNIWHLAYPLEDGSGQIVVATTRPETMLGDVAVAVNPKDKRYAGMVGKMLRLPLTDRLIPIIADDYVDASFGSGAVKITPAHDPNDFEVGARHGLPVLRVMNDDATMNAAAGIAFDGLDRYTARKKVLADLDAQKLLVKTVKHTNNVGHCYRCNVVIEPIVSKQWFVKMKPLAEPAVKAVKATGKGKKAQINFVPKRYQKTYLNWMENIRDWCISRQLWWGHRIPAYYCECGHMQVTMDKVTACAKCKGNVRQDEDVLDTWFSSALWPFATLGWPDNNPDLSYFYPGNVLVTMYDIIFFWVARMIFSGLEYMGDVPFNDVLIHGMIRDAKGRKMSKSLGNGIDPLEVIDTYGADALRFSLVHGTSMGSDIRYSLDKVDGYRNFVNKIWNASRYVLSAVDGKAFDISEVKLSLADKWILSRLNTVVAKVTKCMDKYDVNKSAGLIYDFVWGEFCDWYIELSKVDGGDSTKATLTYVLDMVLRLLHPFTPFVTEEIYGHIAGDKPLITQDFPIFDKKLSYRAAERQMEEVMDIIRKIRVMRADNNVSQSVRTSIVVLPVNDQKKKLLKSAAGYIEKLAMGNNLNIVTAKPDGDYAVIVTNTCEIFIPMSQLVDKEAEIARLKKELEMINSEIVRAQGKLNNQGFVAKAPKELIDSEKAKLEKYIEQKKKIEDSLIVN